MVNKILQIFIKIFAFFLIFVVAYILFIFMMPNMADQYGNPEINAKIRMIKDASLNISNSDGSLSIPF